MNKLDIYNKREKIVDFGGVKYIMIRRNINDGRCSICDIRRTMFCPKAQFMYPCETITFQRL